MLQKLWTHFSHSSKFWSFRLSLSAFDESSFSLYILPTDHFSYETTFGVLSRRFFRYISSISTGNPGKEIRNNFKKTPFMWEWPLQTWSGGREGVPFIFCCCVVVSWMVKHFTANHPPPRDNRDSEQTNPQGNAPTALGNATPLPARRWTEKKKIYNNKNYTEKKLHRTPYVVLVAAEQYIVKLFHFEASN